MFSAPERPDVVAELPKAKKLALYSISPYEVREVDWHGDASAEERKKRRFHGREVYGEIIPESAEVTEQIREAVLAAFASIEPRPPIMCFEPRHAICVSREGLHFDLLLCRECETAAVVYHDEFGELREDFLPLGKEGFDVLNSLLDQRGIFREKPPAKESRESADRADTTMKREPTVEDT